MLDGVREDGPQDHQRVRHDLIAKDHGPYPEQVRVVGQCMKISEFLNFPVVRAIGGIGG